MRRARITTRASAMNLPSVWASAFDDCPLSSGCWVLGALGGCALAPSFWLLRSVTARVHSIGDEASPHACERAHLALIQGGELRVDRLELLDDGGGDDEAGEPFVVGGRDIPRRVVGRGTGDHLLIGALIVLPPFAFPHVGGG